MTEVTSAESEPTLKERIRIVGTITIFVLVCAAAIFADTKNNYPYSNSVDVAPGAVEAQLAVERAERIEYWQSRVKILRDGNETYYLYSGGERWDIVRPNFLDENDQAFLTPKQEAYAEQQAEEAAVNNTIVGSSPAWMGFGEDAITFEENSDRFMKLTTMLWMGFLCSLPLYMIFFKRDSMFDEFAAYLLVAIMLVVLGLIPLIVVATSPIIYGVAYAVPLISMMLLWRLTREKKVPPTPASTELASA